MEHRGQFGSKIGFILAAAGSAVGLGNIWKLPGKAYYGGGGTFLLIYILMVALIGTTVMLAEFVIGRKTHKNAIGALRELNSRYTWIGAVGVLTGFIILCYYCQVGGWTMKYVLGYLTQADAIYEAPVDFFYGMLGLDGTGAPMEFPLQGAIIFPLIFLFLTSFIINQGVSGGIEKLSTILMPILLVLLLVMMVRACTLEGASEGLSFMLSLNAPPENITADGVDLTYGLFDIILVALGQAFFSLSLGMGVMITYSSYLSKDENLVNNTGMICVLDTLVALFAAFMIIPALFATGTTPGTGAGFAFITLAGVFDAIPGGTIFGITFYALLFFAALTSSVSIMEGTIAYLTEEKHIDRKVAITSISGILFVVGVLYTLSQGYMSIKGIWWSLDGFSFPIFGDFLEYLTDRFLLPFGALVTAIFVGWIWGTDKGIREATSDGKYPFKYADLWVVLVKYVAPAAIFFILTAGILFGMNLS